MYSQKLRINTQRTRPDGTAALFFQVIIFGSKTTVPMHLHWPANCFDPKTSTIVPRQRGDTLHADYLLDIERKAGQINEVFIWARLAKVQLTCESFQRELANAASRDDFLAYWQREASERHTKGVISKATLTCHLSSLETLRTYQPKLLFNELNRRFLDEYRAWLCRQAEITSINTVWKKLRDVRTYCNQAKEGGYLFEYPFEGFTMPQQQSRLDYLTEAEFQTLLNHYHSPDLDERHITTLRAFLFACYTGLRISDLVAVTWREVRNNTLAFRPTKRTREIMPQISVPLHPAALTLIPSKKGVLIPTVAKQSMNDTIKTIARKLDINAGVSFHWARHTFATRFLRHGGGIEVLQQLLGHKKIETTMIYVHVDEERKRRQVDLIPF
jgi:integrase